MSPAKKDQAAAAEEMPAIAPDASHEAAVWVSVSWEAFGYPPEVVRHALEPSSSYTRAEAEKAIELFLKSPA